MSNETSIEIESGRANETLGTFWEPVRKKQKKIRSRYDAWVEKLKELDVNTEMTHLLTQVDPSNELFQFHETETLWKGLEHTPKNECQFWSQLLFMTGIAAVGSAPYFTSALQIYSKLEEAHNITTNGTDPFDNGNEKIIFQIHEIIGWLLTFPEALINGAAATLAILINTFQLYDFNEKAIQLYDFAQKGKSWLKEIYDDPTAWCNKKGRRPLQSFCELAWVLANVISCAFIIDMASSLKQPDNDFWYWALIFPIGLERWGTLTANSSVFIERAAISFQSLGRRVFSCGAQREDRYKISKLAKRLVKEDMDEASHFIKNLPIRSLTEDQRDEFKAWFIEVLEGDPETIFDSLNLLTQLKENVESGKSGCSWYHSFYHKAEKYVLSPIISITSIALAGGAMLLDWASVLNLAHSWGIDDDSPWLKFFGVGLAMGTFSLRFLGLKASSLYLAKLCLEWGSWWDFLKVVKVMGVGLSLVSVMNMLPKVVEYYQAGIFNQWPYTVIGKEWSLYLFMGACLCSFLSSAFSNLRYGEKGIKGEVGILGALRERYKDKPDLLCRHIEELDLSALEGLQEGTVELLSFMSEHVVEFIHMGEFHNADAIGNFVLNMLTYFEEKDVGLATTKEDKKKVAAKYESLRWGWSSSYERDSGRPVYVCC